MNEKALVLHVPSVWRTAWPGEYTIPTVRYTTPIPGSRHCSASFPSRRGVVFDVHPTCLGWNGSIIHRNEGQFKIVLLVRGKIRVRDRRRRPLRGRGGGNRKRHGIVCGAFPQHCPVNTGAGGAAHIRWYISSFSYTHYNKMPNRGVSCRAVLAKLPRPAQGAPQEMVGSSFRAASRIWVSWDTESSCSTCSRASWLRPKR